MPIRRVVLESCSITTKPELITTNNGTKVVNLRVAQNNYHKDKKGDKKQDTLYITVVAWGDLAENCCRDLDVGSRITVDGKLRSRTRNMPDGSKQQQIDLHAEEIHYVRDNSSKREVKNEDKESDGNA